MHDWNPSAYLSLSISVENNDFVYCTPPTNDDDDDVEDVVNRFYKSRARQAKDSYRDLQRDEHVDKNVNDQVCIGQLPVQNRPRKPSFWVLGKARADPATDTCPPSRDNIYATTHDTRAKQSNNVLYRQRPDEHAQAQQAEKGVDPSVCGRIHEPSRARAPSLPSCQRCRGIRVDGVTCTIRFGPGVRPRPVRAIIRQLQRHTGVRSARTAKAGQDWAPAASK